MRHHIKARANILDPPDRGVGCVWRLQQKSEYYGYIYSLYHNSECGVKLINDCVYITVLFGVIILNLAYFSFVNPFKPSVSVCPSGDKHGTTS